MAKSGGSYLREFIKIERQDVIILDFITINSILD